MAANQGPTSGGPRQPTNQGPANGGPWHPIRDQQQVGLGSQSRTPRRAAPPVPANAAAWWRRLEILACMGGTPWNGSYIPLAGGKRLVRWEVIDGQLNAGFLVARNRRRSLEDNSASSLGVIRAE